MTRLHCQNTDQRVVDETRKGGVLALISSWFACVSARVERIKGKGETCVGEGLGRAKPRPSRRTKHIKRKKDQIKNKERESFLMQSYVPLLHQHCPQFHICWLPVLSRPFNSLL